MERAAYTWINRLLALRAMEARGLIDEILRSDPAYDGLSEALFILRQTQPRRAAGPDGGWWAVIEDACRAQAASLPGLFDLADPSAALRPSTPALLRCVALIGTPPAGYTAEEADATFADPDAIGWAYQFYQEEAKARTYAKLNSGGKAATRAEIAVRHPALHRAVHGQVAPAEQPRPHLPRALPRQPPAGDVGVLHPRPAATSESAIRAPDLQSAICNLDDPDLHGPLHGERPLRARSVRHVRSPCTGSSTRT